MRLCPLCYIMELLSRHGVGDATLVVLPHPEAIVPEYEKYVIDRGEAVSWKRGAFTPDETKNMLFIQPYVLDP